MPVTYGGTQQNGTAATASTRIAANPRAIIRVTLARPLVDAPLYAIGALRWRNVVAHVLDNSASAAGYPIGGNLSGVTDEDRIAVLDYLSGSHPGALTLSDLARAVEDASIHANVTALELRPPVPATSAGGSAAQDADRDAARTGAEAEADRESLAGRLGELVAGGKRILIVGGIVAIIVLAAVYLPRPSSSSST